MEYKYDVALSYQSEMQETAQLMNDFLKTHGLAVFFAPACQLDILLKKLPTALYDKYRNQSFIRLLLVSDAYLSSEWTLLEKRVSVSQNETDRKRRIIVDYTQNKSLPSDLKELVYIDGKSKYEDEIASWIADYICRIRGEREKK